MLHPSRLPGVLARAAHPSSPPRRNSCLEHIARFRAPRALRRRTKVQLSWVFRPFAQPPKNHRLAKRMGEGSWSGPDRVRKPAHVALGRRRTSPPRCVRPPNVIGDLFHLGSGSVQPVKSKLPPDHNSIAADEYGSYTTGADRSRFRQKIALTLYLGIPADSRCRLILL